MKKTLLSIVAFCFATMLLAQVQTKPVAVYLQNLPCARIGSLSDSEIKTQLENNGFYVLPLDCSTFPKTSPELETALVEWYKTLPSQCSTYETESLKLDLNNIYFIPEGYTYDKVAVWNIVEHGADGSLEYIIKTYNKEIVPVYGKDSAFVYTDMVDKSGNQLDYNMYVDIIYPSGTAAKQVPLLLNHSSNSPRQSPFNPTKANQVVYRTIFQLGFLTTGYAYANMDHCFNPVARNDVYKYFDNGYTLDDWNGLASNTACVRYIKSHLSQYNLNGKIGCMGISKASYAPMRLSDPNNAEGKEHFFFNGKENDKPQPWQGAGSSVDVVYSAAGNGSVRIPTYVNEGCVPMITSAGLSDEYNQWAKYPPVVSHLNKIDHNFLSFWMEELGHTYPGLGTDLRTGQSRYVMFKTFFDRYLKPLEVDTTAILYILPKEGAKEVTTRGESRVLAPDGLLPDNMMGISAYEPITVRYMYDVDTTNLSSWLQVVDAANQPIKGEWTKHMQGTCLQFTPAAALTKGETYRLMVGQTERTFVVTEESETDKEYTSLIVPAKEDAYTKVALCTTVYGNQDILKVRFSQYGDWKFYSYLKFDLPLDNIHLDQLRNVEIRLASASTATTPVTVEMHVCSNEWSETTLVSANRPTHESAVCAQISFVGDATWNTFDVSSAVGDAIKEKKSTISFALIPTSSSTEYANFVSKEGANETLHPQLVINEYKPSPTSTAQELNEPNRKTTKYIQNGEFIIEKDNVRYNAIGLRM